MLRGRLDGTSKNRVETRRAMLRGRLDGTVPRSTLVQTGFRRADVPRPFILLSRLPRIAGLHAAGAAGTF